MSAGKTAYLYTSAFAWWPTRTGGLLAGDHEAVIHPHLTHIAHPDTKRLGHEALEVSGLIDHLERIKPVPATKEDILTCHDPAYVARVETESAGFGGDCGDGVSWFGKNAYKLALLSAGSCLELLKAVHEGRVKNGYSLNHPPGHHAEPSGGKGFCMFNNVSIAAEYAVRHLGYKRVAIVDFDVHHGNGAEKIFWERSDVLTVSIHQDRCFPSDSGFASSKGENAGYGYNLNIPLVPGSGTGAYEYAFDTIIIPALARFKPEIILCASGQDPNMMDPLGRSMVTADGFGMITNKLVAAAEQLCGGKITMNQEGGYSQHYVPICLHRQIEALAGVQTMAEDPFFPIFGPMRGQDLEPHQKDAIDVVLPNLELIK